MPLFTLTSDAGWQNPVVAMSKGRLLRAYPQALPVDISHDLPPFNLAQAVYVFKQSYRLFPDHTFHFILTDLYAHPGRQLLYAFENNQHIFCADNGFLTMLFDDQALQLYRLTERVHPYDFIHVLECFLSVTDSIIHHQSTGLQPVGVQDILVRRWVHATLHNEALEAQVLHIDPFGNVVLNVSRQQFEETRGHKNFRILFMHDEELNQLSQHYNDVPEGEKLCLFNRAGYLEIAVNRGDAARLFGFSEQTDRALFYNTVKIFFE